MSDCDFHSQINAYHDGELDAEAAALVKEHLARCSSCRDELAELGEISRLFSAWGQAPGEQASGKGEMLPLELARLHRELEKSTTGGSAETDFLRTAGMLSALAASILIISGVWLAEFPSRHAAILSPGVAVVPASELNGVPAAIPDWERTALTLRVDPFPGDRKLGGEEKPAVDQIGLADAGSFGDNSVDSQVADWMVAGLSAGAAHANP